MVSVSLFNFGKVVRFGQLNFHFARFFTLGTHAVYIFLKWKCFQ